MTVPSTNVTQVVNGLGISPGSTGKMLCIAGPSSGGIAALNTPIALARVSDVIKNFGSAGPLIEFGCYSIARYGKAVLLMQTAASTPGSAGTTSAGSLVLTGWHGTSPVSVTGTPTSSWAYQLQVVLGGTFGTGPITIQYSLNGGTSWSGNVSLGTNLTYAIPGTGLTLHFTTSDTCVTGDIVTGQATAAVDATGVTGSSAITVTGTPNDDYEYGFQVVSPTAAAAAVGTGPIYIQTTLDAGRTWSPSIKLTTATTYTIPNSGITINFGTGNLNPGDVAYGVSTAPAVTTSDLGTATTANSALANLYASAKNWECLLLASAMDAAGTVGGVLDAFIVALRALGKGRWWLANTALPTYQESDSTYQTSLQALSNAYATNVAAVCGGAARTVSSNTGRSFNYIRPVSMSVGPFALSVPEHIRISETDLGLLPGVSITDQNGAPAPRCHDEMLYPGIDDMRFLALRTDPNLPGVYVNRPHMFGASGSDFDMIPKIRIWNLAFENLFAFFKRRLQKPVLADPKTGFIHELYAKELESSANQALIRACLNKVSAPVTGGPATVQVARNDPLLNVASAALTVDARVIPMGYFDFVNLSLGFAVTVLPATPANSSLT